MTAISKKMSFAFHKSILTSQEQIWGFYCYCYFVFNEALFCHRLGNKGLTYILLLLQYYLQSWFAGTPFRSMWDKHPIFHLQVHEWLSEPLQFHPICPSHKDLHNCEIHLPINLKNKNKLILYWQLTQVAANTLILSFTFSPQHMLMQTFMTFPYSTS